MYIEGETQKLYLKRFCIEAETKLNSRTSFIGEHSEAKYLGMNTDVMPRLLLSYKVSDAGNCFPDDEINVEEFIGVKSHKAKGKRLSTREIDSWQFLEPFQPETSAEEMGETNATEMPEEPLETACKDNVSEEKNGGNVVQMDLFENL